MNTDKKKRHYEELDLCRGIGIILVVLGHALKQTGVTNRAFELLLSVIYSFHMPVFFMVSGFVSVKILEYSGWRDRRAYVKNRAVRLLVPYFAVGCFYMPIKYVLSRYAVKPYDFAHAWKILLGENPNTVLWFLYTLFWISALSVCVLREKNFQICFLLSGILSVGTYVADLPIQITKYWFFFLAGMYLRQHYEQVRAVLGRGFGCGIAAVFVLANFLLVYTQTPGWTFITAVTGCLGTLMVSSEVVKCGGILKKVLSLCGTYSMDIYILSDLIATAFRILLWGILGMNYLICTILCFLVSMVLPIPISKYVIRKVKILRLLVLGVK